METLAQFLAETLFGEASRSIRRRRAARVAASLGLRFHPEGRPEHADPDAAASLDELEALGLHLRQPVANTFAGSYQSRRMVGFANPAVWNRRRRRHVTYRFTAVALTRPLPDLLISSHAESSLVWQWFDPDSRCLPVPVPQSASRTVAAADPAFADSVLKALMEAGEEPLERSWMLRANWVVGWHRGHLRTGGGRDAEDWLRFLSAAADACERS
ncbi:hypothetical protein [Glycomyces arizonensis]|uniref:hypothetical protein n=1 Tax=Glycomyces arizonensis TaxID=256035 RepID=UPI00040964A9|nr:hypothetical protein [Glycomyces arizonensis]